MGDGSEEGVADAARAGDLFGAVFVHGFGVPLHAEEEGLAGWIVPLDAFYHAVEAAVDDQAMGKAVD